MNRQRLEELKNVLNANQACCEYEWIFRDEDIVDLLTLVDSALSEPTSEEVQRAIDECDDALKEPLLEQHGEGSCYHFSTDAIRLFITALQQTQAKELCELCQDGKDIRYTTEDTYGWSDFCPNCGRQLKDEVEK